MKKYKKLHKSWTEKSELIEKNYFPVITDAKKTYYIKGANDFRKRALKALETFSVSTVDEPVIYKDKVYVSQEDVVYLIEHLWSDTRDTKSKKVKK